jgi:hypothetical protein
MPLEERFRHASGGACAMRGFPSEITSFDSDSRRCSQIVLRFIDSFVFLQTVAIKAETGTGHQQN